MVAAGSYRRYPALLSREVSRGGGEDDGQAPFEGVSLFRRPSKAYA